MYPVGKKVTCNSTQPSEFEANLQEMSAGGTRVAFSGKNIWSTFMLFSIALAVCCWVFWLSVNIQMANIYGVDKVLSWQNWIDFVCLAFPLIFIFVATILAFGIIPGLARMIFDNLPDTPLNPIRALKNYSDCDLISHVPAIPTTPPRFIVLV